MKNFRRTILLAGASASGKSTLAKHLGRHIISTSERLRMRLEVASVKEMTDDFLFWVGMELDKQRPHWMTADAMEAAGHGVVVDSIRSRMQETVWCDVTTDMARGRQMVVDSIRPRMHETMRCDFTADTTGSRQVVVKVNVICDLDELQLRHMRRGTVPPKYTPFLFDHPDFVWKSDMVPVSHAVQAIRAMSGNGFVDVVIGAQYGSEGKGKLCALLAKEYDVLVRSGGPNAGHWVRDLGRGPDSYEYCFHNIPSGTIANPKAKVMVAAGAAIHPERFYQEVMETGCATRLVLDSNAMSIQQSDIDEERIDLVSHIGSTGQGVGAAMRRRIQRRPQLPHNAFQNFYGHVSSLLLDELAGGARVMLEGTQGSGLSLYHGPYPYVTSRDTNVSGMLSEVGIPPTWVRDVWMVVRSLPIRTGGNSGPMLNELTWDKVEERLDMSDGVLRERERTSTTNRIRRVGEFNAGQFKAACRINQPTKLFLTFADYITPEVAGVKEWDKLGQKVMDFVSHLEAIADCPVAGASTGRTNAEVAWRPGYEPREVG